MQIEELLKSLSIKEKLYQMFILGFSGKSVSGGNLNIQTAIKSGLAGVILFSENIESYEQTAKLTKTLQKAAAIPLFISIDQEGGMIERTNNIKNKINYLTPRDLGLTQNPDSARSQAEVLSDELKFMGVNMNFAPVIDVNTNPNNPIIGPRSFGSKPGTVIEFAKPFYQALMRNSIIPVIKHFPGHGATGEDSHLIMPVLGLSFEELENIHIRPFAHAIKDGINAVMISHVHYEAFDREPVPASLSENVINSYLRKKLGFNGLVISDDMVMCGVKNYCNTFEACMQGINAGVDLFIYRDLSDETLNIIDKLCDAVVNSEISEDRIDDSVKKILLCKQQYNFWNPDMPDSGFNPGKLQAKIDEIATILK